MYLFEKRHFFPTSLKSFFCYQRKDFVKNEMVMKKLMSSVCALFMIVACTNSPAQKAEALIKSSKTIAKGTTYEVIQTTVDSAFTPQDDPDFFKQMEEATQMNERYNALQKEFSELKDSIAKISNRPELKKECDDLIQKQKNIDWEIGLIKDKGHEKYNQLMEIAVSEPRFIGFKAMHTYRIHNEAGSTLPITEFYLLDTEMTQIKYSCDSIYYAEAQEGIHNLVIAKAIKDDREGK